MNEPFFVKNLLHWHDHDNNRSLPWKGETDPYKIWLSEILLQQTRAEQAINYYHSFTKSFPDICTLARAPDRTVLKLWEGLGYYSRCRNMIETAQYVCNELNGVFPSDYQDIISLKGIGSYTAAAISSFAFKLPYAVVDGNVKRVLARFFGIQTPVDTPEGTRIIRQLADRLLYRRHPDRYNQAIMDFGATVCKPTNPQCPLCPLNSRCVAYKTGQVQLLPVKLKKIKIKLRYFNYLRFHYKDYDYIRIRKAKDIWMGLYEYPLLESDHLLTIEEIFGQAKLGEYFQKNIISIKGTSQPIVQKLTHQKIIAQFTDISVSKKVSDFWGARPVRHNKMRQYPFPKIITGYLEDENK